MEFTPKDMENVRSALKTTGKTVIVLLCCVILLMICAFFVVALMSGSWAAALLIAAMGIIGIFVGVLVDIYYPFL
jgi:uncharacterized membrane protein